MVEGFKGADFGSGKHRVRRQGAYSVARLGKLNSDGGSAGGNCHQLDEAVCGLDLAVFDLEPLFFQRPEELLDIPSKEPLINYL